MPKKICKPRNGRKIGRSVVEAEYEKWKRRIAEGCVIKPKEEPKPTNWWERVGQLDELVPCAICGKRVDPDTAVASGYNGDLCCSEHFSKDVVEVKSAFIRGFEACQEHKQTISDLQDRLALAENRVENLTRSLKNAKRKIREKAAKLEACREQIGAMDAPSSLNVCDVKLLGRLLRHEGNTSGFYHNPIALKSLLRKGLISDAGGAGEYVVNPAERMCLACSAMQRVRPMPAPHARWHRSHPLHRRTS